VARLEGLIDPPHAFLYQLDPRNFRNLLANDPRNLFQICCLLDDSAAIIKWGAMENSVPTAERSTVASSVVQSNGAATASKMFSTPPVGMVLATSARELELASKNRGLGRAPLPMRFEPDSPLFRI
jgi:hypothetical protein